MTILMLLRHARAEPGGGGDDFERALTGKGEADAQHLGRHLRQTGPRPDFALASSAKRTRQTLDLVSAELAETGTGVAAQPVVVRLTARLDDDLFNATATQMLDKIVGVAADCLLVVGHNPAVAELAAFLAGKGERCDLDRLRNRFPPGGLAVLGFPGEGWQAVRAGGGRLQALILPEDLSRD